MAFTIDDNLIWGSQLFISVVFSVLALDFPLRAGTGQRVMPGVIWTHVRAMIFPLFASISWLVMGAFAVAAGNAGTNPEYLFFYMLFVVYLVIAVAMILYLAFNPTVEVLQGREKLEDG